MKHLVKFLGLAALVGVALTFPMGANSHHTEAYAEANAASSTDSSVKAQTPSDANQSRIKSIRRNEYFYQSYGRPDLTAALVTGAFEPTSSPEIVDVNVAKLVGVMWGPTDRFALLEDGDGNGFILRVGDRVRNGRISAIHEESVVASVSLYGISSRVILRLEKKEG